MSPLNVLSSITPPHLLHPNTSPAEDTIDVSARISAARNVQEDANLEQETLTANMEEENDAEQPQFDKDGDHIGNDEKTPLLSIDGGVEDSKPSSRWYYPRVIAGSVAGTIKIVLSTLTAPVTYVITCFYDEEGRFSAVLPLYRISRSMRGNRRRTDPVRAESEPNEKERPTRKGSMKTRSKKTSKRSPSATSVESNSAISSDSEVDSTGLSSRTIDGPARHTRSRSSFASSSGEEIAPSKRSIRIKLHSEEASRQRKRQSQNNSSSKSSSTPQDPSEAAAAALKSPSSPASSAKITKFPRAPQPPRPLVPRRQPSYSAAAPMTIGPHPHKKTLIIDLDETLIHSMSKGGRFTTGHMVEVKLQQPVPVAGTMLTPQVPILYYVHKRPHCDEFLRKVSKWYNLIVFTASVQEYADPVINWLELERKYFYRRLYRQHCTFRNGSYIKDLSQVEPDLSKVMILDNSPMSYVFHEDNAIPIEGWISDPTDNDLLHLIPFLEGLQYVTDVRALLALRLGEPQSS